MKNINTSALALCVLTLVVVCGPVFSTEVNSTNISTEVNWATIPIEVNWTTYDYPFRFEGIRCVPHETLFEADDIDAVTCGRTCHFSKQCLGLFYQPDNRRCIGSRVYFYGPLWTHRYKELPGATHIMTKRMVTNCKEVLENDPSAESGQYKLTIGVTLLTVYCDMTTDGGGWTVFLNRFDGSVDFYRNLSEYENGFGDTNGEFWLGLKHIQTLTDKHPSEFRLEVTTFDGVEAHEQYTEFRLLDGTNYTLFVGGNWTTSEPVAGSWVFSNSNGSSFSTLDRDMDLLSTFHCANYHSAWWYGSDCSGVMLTGEYCNRSPEYCHGKANRGLIHLDFSNEILKAGRMMIRPI